MADTLRHTQWSHLPCPHSSSTSPLQKAVKPAVSLCAQLTSYTNRLSVRDAADVPEELNMVPSAERSLFSALPGFITAARNFGGSPYRRMLSVNSRTAQI